MASKTRGGTVYNLRMEVASLKRKNEMLLNAAMVASERAERVESMLKSQFDKDSATVALSFEMTRMRKALERIEASAATGNVPSFKRNRFWLFDRIRKWR